jgi:transposase InsO family protein
MPRASREQVLELVEACGGKPLSAADRKWICEQAGISTSGLYRITEGVETAAPVFDEDATFLDRMRACGKIAFEFDDLAIGMLAGHGGNMKAFAADVDAYFEREGSDVRMLSLPQLSRKWNRTVPLQVRDGVRNGHTNRFKTTLRARWEADHVGQMAQLDEFILDFACLTSELGRESDFVDENGRPLEAVELTVGGKTRTLVPIRPRLLLIEDVKSRMITAWALLENPPCSQDTVALLADAFDVRAADDGSGALIGGHFDILMSDNAMCFRSEVVGAAVALAGTQLDIAVGYDPVAKGKVERVGGTIQRKVVTALPGYLSRMASRSGRDMLGVATEHLLPFTEAVALVAAAIYEYNYVDVHSSLGCTPFEAFTKGCPTPRTVPDEDLASMMLAGPRAGGARKVLPDGIQVFGKRGFIAPELARPDVLGNEVLVRTFHHRENKVAVFKRLTRRTDPDAVEFLGFAHSSDTLSKSERVRLLNIWAAGARTIDGAASTARELAQLAAEAEDVTTGSLAEAAALREERRRAADELLDAVDDDATSGVVNPGRRPGTVRRPKPTPVEHRSPASTPTSAEDDLSAIEAGIAASCVTPDPAPEHLEEAV